MATNSNNMSSQQTSNSGSGGANNSHHQTPNNKNLMQELLSKIQKVSNEEYESLYSQIFELLDENKHKASERPNKEVYIEKLVDLYLQTCFSERVFKILVGISSPLDECLFNILMKKIKECKEKRFAVFILISNIIHRSPTWLLNIVNPTLLNCFFNILKNEQEIVILAISALILVELITALPCVMARCLDDIFTCFSRLSTFLYKGMNINDKKNSKESKKNLLLLHLNSIVYRVFIRLYAMYPCNFLNYLQNIYGPSKENEKKKNENDAVFHQIIEPMLNKIRFHPLLITASIDKECHKSRWLYKEPHDILDECGQYSIDPLESSYYDEDVLQLCEFLNNEQNENYFQYLTYITDNSSTIFSGTAKEINEKEKCSTSVSPLKYHNKESSSDSSSYNNNNLESAQEAIMMSSNNNQDTPTMTTTTPQKNHLMPTKIVSSNNNGGNLVKPVAISANSKMSPNQKRNFQKKQCFSPFKPIKEIGNAGSNSTGGFLSENVEILASKATSPIEFQQQPVANRSNSAITDQFNVNNTENEEVDMEIISYNLEKSVKNQTKDNDKGNKFTVINENEISEEKNKLEDSKIPDELVQNLKTSLQRINHRIRYQSNCLPETDKVADYFYSNGSPLSLSNLYTYSKSCPMLYFKSDDDSSFEIIKETGSDKAGIVSQQQTNNKEETTFNTNSDCATHSKRVRRGSSVEKSSNVNLILENPNSGEMMKHNANLHMNKTCKSVDFTKETKARMSSFIANNQISYDHSRIYYNKLVLSLLMDPSKRHLSSSSISDNNQTQLQPKLEISSPHELLDRKLSTLSDVYLKDAAMASSVNNAAMEEGFDSNGTSRRDSVILNTNSSASSIEHIPSLNYLNTNSNEEDMKKILAIMYAQLVFERHQRDLHVIRNRRLYKKSKECIQLEEKYNSMKEQIKFQQKEIENLHHNLERNIILFEQERKTFNKEILKLQESLEKYRHLCELLQNEKTSLELHYKQEIHGLNKNFRTKELELNKFLCNYNKNVDLKKLEKENQELKNQIFLFGEFCGKISDAYSQSKFIPEINNDKLLDDSLKFENEDLRRRNTDLQSQLKFYLNKCADLEQQIKIDEQRHNKDKNELNEIEYFKDCLKVKENQINVFKTLLVSYDAYIKKLNGEIQSTKLSGRT